MFLNSIVRLTSMDRSMIIDSCKTRSLCLLTSLKKVCGQKKIINRTFLDNKIVVWYYPSSSGCDIALLRPNNSLLHFGENFSKQEKDDFSRNMMVIESFLNEDEEKSLLTEIEPYMRRMRYEFDHWDNAIHGFRETERLKWNEENTKIISRVREYAFPPGSPQLQHVHILDLAEDGHIKPHIDSVRFCGNTIAGLSLLTDAVMRLAHDKDPSKAVSVWLKRRSLYIMRDSVRYDYTHEVLANKESKFRDEHVEKKRRISVVFRNEPPLSS